MPYITTDRRAVLDNDIDNLCARVESCGELNYVLFRLFRGYVAQNGGRYQQVNDAMGATIGSLLEWYRRDVGPYEDAAILKNGDIE